MTLRDELASQREYLRGRIDPTMSAFLTNYYDPDNPPEPDRIDECDRLLGIAFGRGLIFFLYLAITSGDLQGAYSTLQLLNQNLLYGLVAIALLVWTAVPLLRGLEHLIINTKNVVSDRR